MANSFFATLGHVFGKKTREDRIRDALDSAVTEIWYICNDDPTERMAVASVLLARCIKSDFSPDRHARVLEFAAARAAAILGIEPPRLVSDLEAADGKR